MSLIQMHPPMARRAALLRNAVSGDPAASEREHRRDLVDLACARASLHDLPVADVAEATRRVLQRRAGDALQVGPLRGIEPLREWVAGELAGQGLDVDARQVLITSGPQQALDLLGKVLLDPASPLLVQRPTSAAALRAFAPYAPRLVGLRCDEHGPQPQAFAAALPGARMVYLQPCFANPSAQTLTPERAEQLVQALRETPCWLVEDDAYGEPWLDAPPPRGLLSRGAPHGVRVGSFSRLLFPGMCLGWVAGSSPLVDRLALARDSADQHPSSLSQWVLLEMLRDGVLERALPALRRDYRARRDAMLQALQRHMPDGVSWTRPSGGLFIWLTLPRHVDAHDLVAPAREQGVAVMPGGVFDVGAGGCGTFGNCWECRFADDAEAAAPARNTLRLSYASADPGAVELGVQRLAQVLRQALRSEPSGARAGGQGMSRA